VSLRGNQLKNQLDEEPNWWREPVSEAKRTCIMGGTCDRRHFYSVDPSSRRNHCRKSLVSNIFQFKRLPVYEVSQSLDANIEYHQSRGTNVP
jgi:hypothetical protein